MTPLECIGKIQCPLGKVGRMSCRFYQDCLDTLISRLLIRNGLTTTLHKIRQIINYDNNGGISDAILFSRIYNIAHKEGIKIKVFDFETALKASTLKGGDKKNIRRLFEELIDSSVDVK